MTKNLKLLFILLVLSTSGLFANPGDTTLVQCFTFDSIHARRALFQFPAQTQPYNKILMYYTLKCDPQTPWDGYDCGEWDYTTYTNIYNHTGNLDSIEHFHPLFTANGESPDVFLYANQATYQTYPRVEHFYQHLDTASLNQSVVGTGTDISNAPMLVNNIDAKYYYYYSADELIAAGLSSGNITGMRFNFQTANASFNQFSIGMATINETNPHPAEYQSLDYTEVFNRNINVLDSDWQLLDFNQYYNWDGLSDIAICYTYKKSFGNCSLIGSNYIDPWWWQSNQPDYAIDFEGNDYIEISENAYSQIQDEITIAFWLYGDEEIQAQNDMLLEACDENGDRKLCLHLPWGNGSVYWDAGNDGSGYDRINKAASFNMYAGEWTHWTFTKNAVTGDMKIYVNGNLWHSGTGLSKTMAGIDRFVLGANYTINPTYCYDGMLDDFYVTNSEMNEAEIFQLMQNGLHSSDAGYDDILVNYLFDQINGMLATDNGPINANGDLMGMPEYVSYQGKNRFKGFEPLSFRPNVIFEQGVFNSIADSIIVYDTVFFTQQQVITYENADDYTIVAIDTSLYWPAVYQYVYDVQGVLIDSNLVSDGSLVNDELIYYSEAFEIVHKIQVQNFVTPYGIGLDLGNDGFTWIYDVSEYGYLLHDMVDIQAHNTQELIDLKFLMIEGTPPRDILDFKQLYNGSYGHHDIAVDEVLKAKKIKTLPNAEMFTVRARATGHGMEGSGNCAEFCPTYHNIYVDGVERHEWQNWKECSDNPVYPQGGTWIFDRAGWCPGSFADTYNLDISPYVSPGDSVEIDYGMTQCAGTNGEGSYRVAVQFIQYGDYNFNIDAAIHDIIAPSTRDLHNRFNPICNNPRIQIINNGANTLNTLMIHYGLEGSANYTYQWVGDLDFGEVEEVVLPAMDWHDFTGGVSVFEVEISEPNGTIDEYVYNNLMYSEFETTDIYDVLVMFVVKTNNYGGQTHYQILNSAGDVLVDRDNLDSNTMYYDTLDYEPGCYEINFFDNDQGFIGQDGLNFWYWSGTSYDDGNGYAKMRQVGGVYLKHFDPDFGSFFNYQFTIADFDNNSLLQNNKEYFQIYPNPGNGLVTITRGKQNDNLAKIEVFDLYGKKINTFSLRIGVAQRDIDLSELSAGIYTIRYTCGAVSEIKKYVKK